MLWLLGYPDQALRCSEENLAILRSLVQHPYSVAFGFTLAAFLRQYLGDPPATRALAEEAVVISEAHGLAFIGAMASMFEGWARTLEGELDEGMAQMRRGLAAQLATGAELAQAVLAVAARRGVPADGRRPRGAGAARRRRRGRRAHL